MPSVRQKLKALEAHINQRVKHDGGLAVFVLMSVVVNAMLTLANSTIAWGELMQIDIIYQALPHVMLAMTAVLAILKHYVSTCEKYRWENVSTNTHSRRRPLDGVTAASLKVAFWVLFLLPAFAGKWFCIWGMINCVLVLCAKPIIHYGTKMDKDMLRPFFVFVFLMVMLTMNFDLNYAQEYFQNRTGQPTTAGAPVITHPRVRNAGVIDIGKGAIGIGSVGSAGGVATAAWFMWQGMKTYSATAPVNGQRLITN